MSEDHLQRLRDGVLNLNGGYTGPFELIVTGGFTFETAEWLCEKVLPRLESFTAD